MPTLPLRKGRSKRKRHGTSDESCRASSFTSHLAGVVNVADLQPPSKEDQRDCRQVSDRLRGALLVRASFVRVQRWLELAGNVPAFQTSGEKVSVASNSASIETGSARKKSNT